jgi:Zn-dependent membrane protease YugP
LGHVQQYQTGSGLIKMRGFLLPALQFSPTLSYIAIFMGLVFDMTNLIWIGIFFFALMVLFSILTLPVEINASRRGLRLLGEAGLMESDQDAKGARQLSRDQWTFHKSPTICTSHRCPGLRTLRPSGIVTSA